MSLVREHPTSWRFQHRNADGLIVWASGIGDLDEILPGSKEHVELMHDQPWKLNLLTNAGENNINDVYFRATTEPTSFYIGLSTSDEATLGEAATLSGISEVTGTGYARQQVTRDSSGWPTLVGDTVTSSTETFTAGGTWTGAVSAFLTDSPSGTTGGTGGNIAIIISDLSATRTLANGESLDVSIAVTAA